ncbi:MAG: MFS transporter [Clostridium sp.]|nr:MFS transporter [Clostridium sp.]
MKTYIYILICIILIMQLFDSYCTDLFSKLQSFLLSDFLIDGRGMELQDAVSYMGYATLPFYVIPMLAPLVRMSVDKIGIKPLFIGNIIVLIVGCMLCAFAPSLTIYLIGNGLVIFSSSMDLQYIYIAEEIPEHRRATVRGISAGVAAAATMLIPALRSHLIDIRGYSWRSLYVAAIGIGTGTFLISLLLRRSVKNPVRASKETATKNTDTTIVLPEKERKKAIRSLYIVLFLFGMATNGITAYNEPLLSFSKATTTQIRNTLLIQPVVSLVINVLSGYLADKISRKAIILADMLLSAISLIVYVVGIQLGYAGVVSGVAWGFMIGCYFSAANLMILTVLEYAEQGKIGKVSAMSNYANAGGNAIGLLFCTFLVKYTGMSAIKLISAIPVIVVSFIYLRSKNPFQKKASGFHG